MSPLPVACRAFGMTASRRTWSPPAGGDLPARLGRAGRRDRTSQGLRDRPLFETVRRPVAQPRNPLGESRVAADHDAGPGFLGAACGCPPSATRLLPDSSQRRPAAAGGGQPRRWATMCTTSSASARAARRRSEADRRDPAGAGVGRRTERALRSVADTRRRVSRAGAESNDRGGVRCPREDSGFSCENGFFG